MPIAPPNGDPLRAVVRVCDVDSLPLSDGIHPVYLWIINGEDTWRTAFNDETRSPSYSHCVERIARCGPKWDPGVNVTVVIQVDAADTALYHLKALSVPIVCTQ